MNQINELCARVHKANAKWWVDLMKFPCGHCGGRGSKLEHWSQDNYRECSFCGGLGSSVPLDRNVGELLCYVHSEISEALEGHRKNLSDHKLPHRKMFEVELADAIIQIFDIGAGLGLDLGGAFEEKMAYNATRHDHTPEGRMQAGGKKY